MNKVIVVRYDGKQARDTITVDGVPYRKLVNKDGLPCYLLPEGKAVAELCNISEGKYRLLRSEPQNVRVHLGNGKFGWVTVAPWDYNIVTVDTGKLDTNGEKIFVKKIDWRQNDVVIEKNVTEDDILGKAKPIIVENTEYQSKVSEFKDEIKRLRAELAELQVELVEMKALVKTKDTKKKKDSELLDVGQ